MADHPDIPALVARLAERAEYCKCDEHTDMRDAAAALSRLTRALAERDAELAQMELRARRIGEAADETIQKLIAARRERDEALAKVESLELAAFDDLHNTPDAD